MTEHDVLVTPALSCAGLSKSYAGVRVLDAFTCSIAPGGVLALLGENGSGKSTLIKTLAGVVAPDPDGDASVWVGGEELTFGSPDRSLALGCRFVHQDLGLVDDLSIADNMLMVAGFPTRFGAIQRRKVRSEVRADLARVGIEADPNVLVGTLSPATKTGVAVARALRPFAGEDPRVLVLDEPTATLPDNEVERLMEIVLHARASGVGILYVTHRLDEVVQLGGEVTVLRDGRQVLSRSMVGVNKRDLVTFMTGTELAQELEHDAEREAAPGDPRLVVQELQGETVVDCSFTARSGEILGIAGITGSGREAVLSVIFGGSRRDSGRVAVVDVELPRSRPDISVRHGVGYLPPDRKTTGAFTLMTVAENTTIADLRPFSSALRMRQKAERQTAGEWTERMGVRPDRPLDLSFGNLSGGNQQKVLFGKWLRLGLQVFLLDEPTQGVDVHAKALLHRQLVEAADDGLAVVVASTDVEELAALCGRVIVMRGGRVAVELEGRNVTTSAISQAALEVEPR